MQCITFIFITIDVLAIGYNINFSVGMQWREARPSERNLVRGAKAHTMPSSFWGPCQNLVCIVIII